MVGFTTVSLQFLLSLPTFFTSATHVDDGILLAEPPNDDASLQAPKRTAAGPNISFATLPSFYYGSDVGYIRSESDIKYLSYMRVIALLQQDGDCWIKCCPGSHGACTPEPITRAINASVHHGCDPSCDQLGKQNLDYSRTKAAAVKDGRPPPHALLYMNHVYDWPFYAEHAAGAEQIDVLDIHGVPHAEVCDPGIYPTYLLDYGRQAGRDAFLNSIRKNVVQGAADGVFLDNFLQQPLRCKNPQTCFALRSSRPVNNASVVTAAQVEAYNKGMNETLTQAVQLVTQNTGGAFAAFTWGTQRNYNGANMAVIHAGGNPVSLHNVIAEAYANGYKYVLVSGISCVKDRSVALFLLTARAGCFLSCTAPDGQGPPRKADQIIELLTRPLGEPLGLAANGSDGIMRRNFSHGVQAWWDWSKDQGGTIWPSFTQPPLSSQLSILHI